jgi:nitroreductase
VLDGDSLLSTTRAVRRRLDLQRPVPRAVVEDCLRLALQAPAARGRTLCRWLLLDDPDLRMRAALVYAAAIDDSRDARVVEGPDDVAMYASVDHLAVVLADVPVLALAYVESPPPEALARSTSWWSTVVPTIWSFQLALRLRGLGSTLTTAHLGRHDEMADTLGLPRAWRQVALLPVAYTVGDEFSPARRPDVTTVATWNEPPS